MSIRRPPLTTITHARLRAEQGDLEGARRILRRILAATPSDAEANKLMRRLARRRDRPRSEDAEAAVEPRRPADAGALAAGFREALGPVGGSDPRVARLERWLRRVTRG